MNSFFRFIPKLFLILFSAIILATLLITAVYCIPNSAIRDNIISSAETLVTEDAYPNAYSWCQSELDNYTDGIMLSEACCESAGTVLERAMLSNRDVLQSGWLGIYHFVDGRPVAKVDSYARYWHGYLLTLKPLLLVMDYSGIRILNLIIQTLISLLICYLMIRKDLKHYIIPYAISICIISPLVIAKSLQMSTCYYILNISSLAILILSNKNKSFEKFMFFFLWIGVATAFFDFLTYPIATFGVPAVFYLICSTRGKNNKTLRLLNLLFCWGCGYVLMWASKWLLADIITGTKVLANAANEAEIWVTEAKESYTLWYTLYRNIRSFILNPASIVAFIFLVIMFIKLSKSELFNITNRELFSQILPYLIIAVLPFVWYSAMIAHSYVHDFFTSKALITTAFSLLCILEMIKVEDTKKQ